MGWIHCFLGNHFSNFESLKNIFETVCEYIADFAWIWWEYSKNTNKRKRMTWMVEMSHVMTNKTKQNNTNWHKGNVCMNTGQAQTKQQWKITYLRSFVCQKHGFPWQMQKFACFSRHLFDWLIDWLLKLFVGFFFGPRNCHTMDKSPFKAVCWRYFAFFRFDLFHKNITENNAGVLDILN